MLLAPKLKIPVPERDPSLAVGGERSTEHSLSLFLSIIATCVILGLSFFRLRFGVDFSDEAWYVATPYRFVLGDRPYVDEIYLMQGASVLMVPIVKLFHWLSGGTDGIIFFCRLSYLFFTCAVGFSLFLFFRHRFFPSVALLLSTFAVGFAPYGLPTFSYNTLGAGLFLMGLAALMQGETEKRPALFFVSGLLHGLAAISHVTLSGAVAFVGIWLLFQTRRWKGFLIYSTAILLMISSVFSVAEVTPDILFENYRLTKIMNAEFGNKISVEKFVKVLEGMWEVLLPRWHSLVALFAVVILLRKKYPRIAIALFALTFQAALYYSSRGQGPYLSKLALVAPFCWILAKNKEPMRPLVIWLWFPSFVAGLLLSLSSYNGFGAAKVAYLPAIIGGLAGLTLLLFQRWGERERIWERLLLLQPLFQGLFLFTYLQFAQVYMDEKVSRLTEKIPEGPFSGMYTTPKKAAFLRDISNEVSAVAKPTGHILFYPHFPAGYLLTSMQPASPTTWGCMGLTEPICAQYLTAVLKPGDVAVEVRKLLYTDDFLVDKEPEADLRAIVLGQSDEVAARENFTVYRSR